MPLVPGQLLNNRYQIIALLGQGGMGSVYRAYDQTLTRYVAIKERTPDPAATPQTLAQARVQFQREAQVLANLNHANLPRVTDYFSFGASDFLVMDFVDGTNLDALVHQRGAQLEATVLAWAIQLLDALANIHARGVIHRDIKPLNIILTPDGRVMLVDFGLVKVLDPNNPYTATHMRGMGTAGYAPIEQYATGAQHTDARTDLYALGATLYFLLTTREPTEVHQRVVNPAMLITPRALNANISAQTESVVLRAMEVQPQNRFASAGEMKQALNARATVLMSQSIPQYAPRPSSPRLSQVWIWLGGGLSVLVMLLVLGVLGLSGFFRNSSPTPTIVALVSTPSTSLTSTMILTNTAAQTTTPTSTSTRTAPPTYTPMPKFSVLAGTPYPAAVVSISLDNADKIVQLARWGKGTVDEIAWTPDGKQIVVTSSLGIYFYDAETLQQLQFIETNVGMKEVALSPDGKMLASIANDDTIRIWDITSGRVVQTFSGQPNGWTVTFSSIAFLPDGKTLAARSRNTVKLWELPSGREIRTLGGRNTLVSGVVFSPDGKVLVVGLLDKTIELWETSSGRVLQTLGGNTSIFDRFAFSPDGRTLAAGAYKIIKLWDIASGREIRTLNENNIVDSIAFSPDGRLLASASDVDTVRVWDVASGREARTLEHVGWVHVVTFSPDGKMLASASTREGTVKLWNVASGREMQTLSGHMPGVASVAFSPDGKMLVSGNGSTLKLWDSASGEDVRTIGGQENSVSSVTFSPDGKILVSGFLDIALWDTASWRQVRTLRGHTSSGLSVAFSPNGKILASGSGDKTIKLWDVANGREMQTLSGHAEGVDSVAFSPDGKILASGSSDKTIKLWDVASGRELRTLSGHAGDVDSVAFSPDGKMLASGSSDEMIKLWDVASGRELRNLSGHTSGVLSVVFAADGKMLASGSWDSTIKLWDVANGHERGTLSGHTSSVDGVVFSPDGKTLVSGSADGTIRIWGVR